MLGLGLKLLGIGKWLKDFFIQNWKWLVPLIALVIGFFWTKEHYYTLGKEETTAIYEKKIEAERKKNELLSGKLLDSSVKLGERFQKDSEARTERESTHTNRIETIIKEKPVYTQCVVDKEILDAQNAMKELLK
jgi:hypothetical protein